MTSIIENSANTDTTPKSERSVAWYDVFVVFLLFVLSQIIASIVIVAQIGPDVNAYDDGTIEGENLVTKLISMGYLLSMMLSVGLILAYSALRRIGFDVKFFAKGWASPLKLLVGYILIWCASITVEPITMLLPAQSQDLGSGLWLLVSTVVFAPFFEEIIFRGYLVGALKKRFGLIFTWVASSLIFAVVHGGYSAMITAMVAGLILGFYYLRYGSLAQVVMLHAMNNLTVCFMKSVGVAEKSVQTLVANDTIYWTIYAISATVFVVALVVMFRTLRSLKKSNSGDNM